jgi:dTMP kinase
MFLRLATASPEHYLVVDARRPVADVTAEILGRLRPLLGQATRSAPQLSPAPGDHA